MEMKFKTQAAALKEALGVAKIVTPSAITPQGGAGYLFVAYKDEETGKDQCYIYARDDLHVVRAHFPITDLDLGGEKEGAFIFPAQYVKGFDHVSGEISFSSYVEAGNKHMVEYVLSDKKGRAAVSKRGTFDPKLLTTWAKKIEAATKEYEFPAGIFKEALGLSRSWMAEEKEKGAEEHHRVVQVYDASDPDSAKGNGTLFAASRVLSFYFQTDIFKDKGLQIHQKHLSLLTNFLSKYEGDKLVIKIGTNMTFASEMKDGQERRLFGWTHHTKSHGRYKYYGKSNETEIEVGRDDMITAINYCVTQLEEGRSKARITYSAADKTIQFDVLEGSKTSSLPIDATQKSKPETLEKTDFQVNVNLNHFLNLFKDTKGHTMVLRVCHLPADPTKGRMKDGALFRTIDTFFMTPDGKVVGGEGSKVEGAHECKVTRFVPSMD
jgi:hypothetical protein